MDEKINAAVLKHRSTPTVIIEPADPVWLTRLAARYNILNPEALRITDTGHVVHTIKEPVDVKNTVSQNLITIFTLANTVFYVVALFANVFAAGWQGQPLGNWCVPLVFAIAQFLEQCSAITEGLWRLQVLRYRRNKSRPSLRLIGDNVPVVVMIIATCGEPLDVIMDTVKTTLLVDYPKAKFHIIVSDDKGSAELREEVLQLKIDHQNLHYNTRTESRGYKAGNINDCLRGYVKAMSIEPDWICVLDADMMPEKEMLRSLLPHGILDPSVAMVVTGQHFYNIPVNDPLYQSNITGTHAEDGARDSVGTAWCPGSGFVLRHLVWAHVGGFPEFSTTEDLFMSWFLHGAGWQTLLVHETLQWGIQPECFVVHMKQRRRWWTGHLAKAITTWLCFTMPGIEHATWIQRYGMHQHCIRPFNNTVFKALSLLLVLLCCIFPYRVVAVPSQKAVAWVFLSVILQRVVARVVDYQGCFQNPDRLWNMRRRQATNCWLGLHFSWDTMKEILAAWWPRSGVSAITFEVTGIQEKQYGVAHERDEHLRPSTFKRLMILHKTEGILYHACLTTLGFAILIARFRSLLQDNNNSESSWFDIISSVGFPGLGLLEFLPLLMTPIFYALFPPTTPLRRELMDYDKTDQVWRPKEESKKMRWTAGTSIWLEIPHLVALAWACVVMVKYPWSTLW